MKHLYSILFFCISTNICTGQIPDSSFKIIKGLSGLELSYKPITVNGEDIPFERIQQLPKYPGGWNSLSNFFLRNFSYPKTAIENNIQGKVFTSFTVDCEGNVGNVKTLMGVSPELDSTCLQVVNKMRKWKPFKPTDNQILINFILRVKFVLPDNNK